MAVGERLQQFAGAFGRGFHFFGVYFHTCVST